MVDWGGAQTGGTMTNRPGPSRAQLRTALALEEAGELEEAARLFEHAGEQAQAAALRLEHAQTLRDVDARLAVLREGAARNSGETAQGRALHRSLARALVGQAQALEDGARRRGMLIEAAQALEAADEGGDAGALYEQLGLLSRAAKAYEAAGAIGPLEVVLEVLEHNRLADQAMRRVEREIDLAHQEGHRRLARNLLEEHTVARKALGQAPKLAMAAQLADLEQSLPRRRRLTLSVRSGDASPRAWRVHGSNTFRIGRAPDADFSLSHAGLSREHVALAVEQRAGVPVVVATDLGSRAGTFWLGDPLDPGFAEPLTEEGELGLGLSTALDLVPWPASEGSAGVEIHRSDNQRALFLPFGGSLARAGIPARLIFEDPYIALEVDVKVRASLNQVPLGPGARLELLLGDHLVLSAPGEPEMTIEVQS